MNVEVVKRKPVVTDYATHYAEIGWPVLTVAGITADLKCTCGNDNCKAAGKHPMLADWPNKSSMDLEVIRNYFANHGDLNVGICTGQRSRLVVLDVDARSGGLETLEECLQLYGDLPLTPMVHTGGGGNHYYFKCPLGGLPSRISLLPGIDLKCEGGYVVAPPSRHLSGKEYVWDTFQDIESIPMAPLPDWLQHLIVRSAQIQTDSKVDWQKFIDTRVQEGGRNSNLAKLTGHLLRRWVDPYVCLKIVYAWNCLWCDPPLDFQEVLGIVNSISRIQLTQLTQGAGNA